MFMCNFFIGFYPLHEWIVFLVYTLPLVQQYCILGIMKVWAFTKNISLKPELKPILTIPLLHLGSID